MDPFTNAFKQAMSQSWQNKKEEMSANGSELELDEEVKQKKSLSTSMKSKINCGIKEAARRCAVIQRKINGLVNKLEEFSDTLAIDISVPPRVQGVPLVEHIRQLEELVAKYSDEVEQRRNRVNRLQKWQTYLVTKMGIAKKDIKSDPLPSNEELDRIEARLENHQIGHDYRAEKFLLIQVEVKQLMAELKMKPRNRFERKVLNCTSAEFKLHTIEMKRLTYLHQELLVAEYHAIKKSSNA